MSKTCERCQNEAIRGERFCNECKKKVLAEMKEAGYLTQTPFAPYRTADQQENTRETKFGRDG